MDYTKLRHCRHADPLKVRQVWDTLGTVKSQRVVMPSEKLVKSLRKSCGLKDDQIRLLLDEIEGDGLIEKVDSSSGKNCPVGYRLPDFTKACPRETHDWYCFHCHKPGEVRRCSDCFRVYHTECAQEASELSSPSRKSIRSPTLHDGSYDEFTCPVCESRPKCEYSRKQIRKLLEFATHQHRKQPIWKTFLHIGYQNDINKNEYLVFKYTDLELLHRKIKDGRYYALEEFSMDVQLLVHNVCILHGPYSPQADEVRYLLRSINAELKEIQLCTDCYINAKTRLADWISKPCKPPHELIWARNRTPAGAGFYNDQAIAHYYWPAKVLLERDETFEIRFFGGTHERALVKKYDTRSFHIPADDLGVLRRTSTSGALPGGGFERAWNEVSKLQNNIESGYYTHSSGESDLPPSDEDYSDEFYLGARRGTLNHAARSNRTESSRSSSLVKRRRHVSSSSHRTTSTTPTNEDSSPPPPAVPKSFHPPSNRGRKSHVLHPTDHYMDRKLNAIKLNVQPGTPGAAAITALAETKAAMAAAVGRSKVSDLFDLTTKTDVAKSPQPAFPTVVTRGKRGRGRGRPPRTARPISYFKRKQSSSLSNSPSDKSVSSLSSVSNSDSDKVGSPDPVTSESDPSEVDWDPKRKHARGRSNVARGKSGKRRHSLRGKTSKTLHKDSPRIHRTTDVSAERIQTKSPIRGGPRSQSSRKTISVHKRLSSPNKSSSSFSPSKRGQKIPRRHSSDNSAEEDDELTDRCCSPPVSSPEKSSRDGKRRLAPAYSPSRLSHEPKATPPSSQPKHANGANIKRHASSSDGSSYSSSSDSDDSNEDYLNRHRPSSMKSSDLEPSLRGPRSKESRLSGTSTTMLRRPPFAPPLSGMSGTMGNSVFSDKTTPKDSSNTNQFSFLLPSINLENCVTNVPIPVSTSSSTATVQSSLGSGIFTTTANVNSVAGVSQLPRSHLPPNKRAAAAAAAAALTGGSEVVDGQHVNQQSPKSADLPQARKLVSKGSQTAPYSCPNCKECESQREQDAAEHKRAMRELEERLLAQIKEEKSLATQAALEQAQATMREAIEREQKLALEAAEARFAEVLVQTKRRQWCRNCLSEAIYHCCWNTSYCSIPCQQEHWQVEHKRQCRRKR